ncbi:MAG: hypothetical protein GY868_05600 [Deltaproteobacteria bacterium]|nr:hypothetical protein [Deltaproteobacteria bacterium]
MGRAQQISGPASIGISGGPIFSITVDPNTTDSLYVGTGIGIFKSEQGEDLWTPVNSGLGSTYVYDIVIPPITETILYAATRKGISTSIDGGSKWTSAGLDEQQTYVLGINPVTPTSFIAGTAAGIYTSPDSGTTWTLADPGPVQVYSVAIDPQNPLTAYAGSFTNGIYKSTDSGATWTRTASEPEFVYHLIVNPINSALLYAGSSRGLYKSTDSGTTWSLVSADFSTVPVYRLALNPSSPATLYAATDKGIYKSTNDGSTWSAANSGITADGVEGPFARTIAFTPGTPAVLYAGTYSGEVNDVDIYKSSDSAGSWSQINREISNTMVYTFAFDPDDAEILYAGTGTIGIIKSINHGLSWQETNSGLTTYLVKAVALNPSSGTVYAGTPSGLFISADAGESWTATSGNHEIYSIAIDPHANENIYIGTNRSLLVSTDEGEEWAYLTNNLPNPNIMSIVFHPEESGLLYVGTRGDGIFKSTSGGQSWTATNGGLSHLQVLALLIDPRDPDILYAGTRGGGVYTSSSAGADWVSLSPDLEGVTINKLVINSVDSDILYVGTEGKGLYRSIDQGQTWEAGASTLANTTVYDLKLDPDDPQTIFAATQGAVEILTFNSPPDAPYDPVPVDMAENLPLDTLLGWSATDPDEGEDLTCRVHFGTDPSPESNPAGSAAAGAYDPGPLTLNTTYYWQVAVIDSHAEETKGDIWQFSTAVSNPPLVPSSPLPADGAERQFLTSMLSWTGGDTDNEDIVTYDISFGTETPPPLAKENLTAPAFTPSKRLKPFITYYWQVLARDNNGLETEGPVWSFKTGLLTRQCFLESLPGLSAAQLSLARTFRDEVLLRSPNGKKLVFLYKRLSPALIEAIRRNHDLLAFATEILINDFFPQLERWHTTGKFRLPAGRQTH